MQKSKKQEVLDKLNDRFKQITGRGLTPEIADAFVAVNYKRVEVKENYIAQIIGGFADLNENPFELYETGNLSLENADEILEEIRDGKHIDEEKLSILIKEIWRLRQSIQDTKNKIGEKEYYRLISPPMDVLKKNLREALENADREEFGEDITKYDE